MRHKVSGDTHYVREGKTVTTATSHGKDGRMAVTVKTFKTVREAKAFMNQV